MHATRWRLLLRATLLVVLVSPTPASDDIPTTIDDFCAPRTMTIPFEAARPARWNTWVSVTDLKSNYCNDVAIVDLRSKAQKTRAGELLVTFRVTTWTRPGHDKRARIAIEAVCGDATLGATAIDRIDTEESKNARGGAILSLPIDGVAGQTDLELRIALEAVDE